MSQLLRRHLTLQNLTLMRKGCSGDRVACTSCIEASNCGDTNRAQIDENNDAKKEAKYRKRGDNCVIPDLYFEEIIQTYPHIAAAKTVTNPRHKNSAIQTI
jgi:hypothetical protein